MNSNQCLHATWIEDHGLQVTTWIGDNEKQYTDREAVSEALRWVLMHAYIEGVLLKETAVYFLDQIEKAMEHKVFLDSLPEDASP